MEWRLTGKKMCDENNGLAGKLLLFCALWLSLLPHRVRRRKQASRSIARSAIPGSWPVAHNDILRAQAAGALEDRHQKGDVCDGDVVLGTFLFQHEREIRGMILVE